MERNSTRSVELHALKDFMAECVFAEKLRAWETQPSARGMSLPSVPYSDAKTVSNGMSAFPGWPAAATSPRMRCGRQR